MEIKWLSLHKHQLHLYTILLIYDKISATVNLFQGTFSYTVYEILTFYENTTKLKQECQSYYIHRLISITCIKIIQFLAR
jgi:hypothetical protein